MAKYPFIALLDLGICTKLGVRVLAALIDCRVGVTPDANISLLPVGYISLHLYESHHQSSTNMSTFSVMNKDITSLADRAALLEFGIPR